MKKHTKILNGFALILFIFITSQITSQAAFAHNEKYSPINREIVSDSIPKAEIADFRKNFEAVEKQIASKRGTYDDAKRSFNGISGSRVRNLPEFAGRFSVMQTKLTAWNLEVNPKQPPVVVPNNPSNPPKNTGKTEDKRAGEVQETVTGVEHKSLMLSYFPDTMTVGNDFLAYVEIMKDYSVKFGNLTGTNNTLDSISLGGLINSSGMRTGVTNTQVSVELTRDGGADSYTITSRDSKMKTIGDNASARWEWNIHSNAEGEYRLRLSVSYKKDGIQEVAAMNKVFVVKASSKKSAETASDSLPWIIGGILLLIAIIAFVIYISNKNKNERRRIDRNNVNDRQHRNDVNNVNDRNDINRNDVDRDRKI